ncbi:hypothetical protein [Pseudoalteromonas ulvae]|uniref:Uncharacterized protein n=1 Tax=Pseudoalteromonas ulvae TaxID=107327 RepID=A0A244CUG5_PSEDV|nr:hypothetical protein [Pseudoalteromonas ulvae]OUL59253.1 hypothetical protein B1199_03010 [Pseudoalteromonas ulvae]
MNKWCIVSNEALSAEASNELIQVLKDGGCDIGVCHDGANRVFTSVPAITPELEPLVVSVELTEDSTEQALIMQVGAFLKANHTDKILVADSSVFTTLFNHPIHRLWCGNYETSAQLIADYTEIFGANQFSQTDNLESLKQLARAAVFSFIPS